MTTWLRDGVCDFAGIRDFDLLRDNADSVRAKACRLNRTVVLHGLPHGSACLGVPDARALIRNRDNQGRQRGAWTFCTHAMVCRFSVQSSSCPVRVPDAVEVFRPARPEAVVSPRQLRPLLHPPN